MRKFILAFIVIAAAAGFFVPSAIAAPFAYIVAAANDISTINHASASLSEEDGARIAKIACEALTKLRDDPNFKGALQVFQEKLLRPNSAAARELINDIVQFSEEFRKVEAERLAAAGLNPPAVGDALWAAATQRDRANMEKVSAESIISAVGNLQATACKLQAQLAAGIKFAAVRRQALLIGWGVAGAVLITVDIGAGVFSAGSATVVTAASTGLGVAMITTTANAFVQKSK